MEHEPEQPPRFTFGEMATQIVDATPELIARALRTQKVRFGDQVLMTAGPKSYTVEMLADEIEQETELGLGFLESVRERHNGETIADLMRTPTQEEKDATKQRIQGRMAILRQEFGLE